ncbi:MAG TPA: quinone-dependent dihydroorotate dehydrogenase [Rhizomicrobium sp.]
MILNAGAAAMRLLPPETAHRATLKLLRLATPMLPAAPTDDARLAISVLGLRFPNPLGLAAGFDKDAEVPDAMLKLGFGFVECGTVTPLPQTGNQRPRLFRLDEDCAVVNRMGFNNSGMERVAKRLARRKKNGVLGLNIGANKNSAERISDYRKAFARLAPLADYVTVNISSPNTPGLRGLQDRTALERLLALLAEERSVQNLRVPLLLKIAPDIGPAALDDIANVALASGIEGLVVGNTTIARIPDLRSRKAHESGGLSGAPLFAPSTALLKEARARVGAKLLLIGVGGVACGADAYAKIRAGASLVQLYTALAFEGPALIARIKREMLRLMDRDGIAQLANVIGLEVR